MSESQEKTSPEPSPPPALVLSPSLTPEERQILAWQGYLQTLSPQAQAALKNNTPPHLQRETEEASEFRQYLEKLSPQARQRVENLAAMPPPPDVFDGRKPRYMAVVQEEGEWPMLFQVKSADALAQKIKALDGKDVVVWAMLGIPIPISRGPDRMIMLPDNTAIRINTGERIESITSEMITQSDGFLGQPELSIISPQLEESLRKKSKKDPEDDATATA